MSAYAQVTNNKIENVVVADATFAAEHNLTDVPDHVGIGWTFDGTTWSAPPPPVNKDVEAWDAYVTAVNGATTLAELQAVLTAASGFRVKVHPH